MKLPTRGEIYVMFDELCDVAGSDCQESVGCENCLIQAALRATLEVFEVAEVKASIDS